MINMEYGYEDLKRGWKIVYDELWLFHQGHRIVLKGKTQEWKHLIEEVQVTIERGFNDNSRRNLG